MNTIIRNMEASEAKEVKNIGKRAFCGLEGVWVPKPKQALVAVKDEKIVGAILYKYLQSGGKKVGYVDYAFIDPDYHNQGIGGVLYKAATDFLWEQGCDALTAVVKDDNVGSWSLFIKNGFSRVSLPALVRQFGFGGMLKQYFGTPFCFGIGMEYYVALRGETCPTGKDGSIKEITAYLLANLFLFLFMLLRVPKDIGAAFAAYGILIAGGIVAGYIGTLFTKRRWSFRLNNGGLFVCMIVNIFGGVFPMIGNWYPERYENTDSFRKDMGIMALVGWFFVLGISLLPMLGICDSILLRNLGQVGALFLLYRVLAFYPFESFGGQRVYRWKRWVYVLMSGLSLAICAWNMF